MHGHWTVCFNADTSRLCEAQVLPVDNCHMNQHILLMIYSLLSAPLIGMVSNLSKSCYYLLLASISQSWMVSVSA